MRKARCIPRRADVDLDGYCVVIIRAPVQPMLFGSMAFWNRGDQWPTLVRYNTTLSLRRGTTHTAFSRILKHPPELLKEAVAFMLHTELPYTIDILTDSACQYSGDF